MTTINHIDSARTGRLLALEKERCGYPADRVRFTCVSRMAKYYWCGLEAVLKAREREGSRFGVYLRDRLELAMQLGRVDNVPERDIDVLEVCAAFSNKVAPTEVWKSADEPGGGWDAFSHHLKGYELTGRTPNWSVTGEAAEQFLARRLPRARWHFEWNEYILVCEPDGIADDYVYEFKSVKAHSQIGERARRAILQAQLGAYFFKRTAVQVEFAALDKQTIDERESDAGIPAVLRVLRKFHTAESGHAIPVAPRPYKCKNCDYLGKPVCTISPLSIE